MEPRLATSVWVGALLRRVAAAGGFAAILRKGDADAGSVIILLRDRNGEITALSKVNTGAGSIGWQKVVDKVDESAELLAETLEKRRRFDPDLWIVELDIADPERFIDGKLIEN
jgi:hypothetical protein